MSDAVKRLFIPGLVFSILAVSLQWAYIDTDVTALGLNSTLVLAIFWCIVLHNRKAGRPSKSDLVWLTPLWMIGFSFAIFENPWVKWICVWLLPLLTVSIYRYRTLANADGYFWGLNLTRFLLAQSIKPLTGFWATTRHINHELISGNDRSRSDTIRRVVIGILFLLPIAAIVLILLGSADIQFAQLIGDFHELIFDILDLSFFWQCISVALLFVVFISANHCWNNDSRYHSDGEHVRQLDSIVSGIVVGGISLLYLLFVYVQLEQLFIRNLPNDFDQTVIIVKSGFWQLVVLSVLNGVLFLWIYKKTGLVVQNMLRVFVVASGLIVVSAAWRLTLYVYWYGFSYEKFFASYTVLFSLVAFVIMIQVSWSEIRVNIARKLVLLALWFFSIATILPIEQIIFHSNIHLSKVENSRIDLTELTALSADVASVAVRYIDAKVLHNSEWYRWKRNMQNTECNRPWYQLNISAALNCSAIQVTTSQPS